MSTEIKVSNLYGTTLTPGGVESVEIHLTPTLGLDTSLIQDAIDQTSQSAAEAKASENAAKASENAAKASENAAKDSEDAAKDSENAAKESEENAKESEENAAASAQEAADSATAAASSLRPRGDWDASTGNFPTPTLTPDERADFYQISVGGTMSDSNPAQPDVEAAVGDQLYWHLDKDIWYKIDNTDRVSSVNGYEGAVVLDKADIGLGNADNTSDVNKPVSTAQQAALDRLENDAVVNAGSLTSTKVGEQINLAHSGLSSADSWIRMGNDSYDWQIKYVGTTSGTGGNELRFESSGTNGTGKYWQMDHTGNFQYYDGTSLRTMWHSGNDGAGSGLDADLLDGKQASDFATDDHNHDAVYVRNYYLGSPGPSAGWRRVGKFLGSAAKRMAIRITGTNGYGSVNNGDTTYEENAYFNWTWGNGTSGSLDAIVTCYMTSTPDDSSTVFNQAKVIQTADYEAELWISHGTYHSVMVEVSGAANCIMEQGGDSGQEEPTGAIESIVTTYEIWHSGNMGSGSGLDADTVDGYSSSELAKLNEENTFSEANTSNGALIFNADKGVRSNRGGSWPNASLARMGGSEADPVAVLGDIQAKTYIYYKDMLLANDGNGSYTLWHQGNDGAGSGLDADLLDGQHASEFINKSGDEMTDELRFPDYVVYERSFSMIENATPQYILLCKNAANQNVNGSIKLGRTSGHYQSAQLNIIVSSGTAELPYGTILSLQSTQENEEYNLVTVTYNSTSYIAVKYSGNRYPNTGSATFSGRLQGDANSLKVFTSLDLTNEAPLRSNRKFEINGDTIWHGGNDGAGSGLDADKLDGLQSTSFARTDVAEETFDGGTSTTINVLCDDAGQAVVNAMGSNQGTGVFYAGQSITHGGGFLYNGDEDPAFVDEPDSDAIVFYRRESGDNKWVFKYQYNAPSVTFRDTPFVNGNKVWHQGNDGVGSGLDADKVDGLQASQFIRSDQQDNVNGRTRWDNTDSIKLPAGTTAERTTSPEVGDIRFNEEDDSFEGFNSRGWGSIGGGGIPEYDVVKNTNWTPAFSVGNDAVRVGSWYPKGTKYTYSAKVKFNSGSIEGLTGVNNNTNQRLYFGKNASSKVWFGFGAQNSTGTTDILDDVEYLLEMRIDGNVAKCYVDGVLELTINASNGHVYDSILIGALGIINDGNDYDINGIVTDVRFTDLTDPGNSRHYPNILSAADQPTLLVSEDTGYIKEEAPFYTPAYGSATDTYTSIPEWVISADATIEFKTIISSVTSETYTHWFGAETGSLNPNLHVRSSDNVLYLQTGHGTVYINDVEQPDQSDFTPYYDKEITVRLELTLEDSVISNLGARTSTYGGIRGKMWDIRLTDNINPKNSRYYPSLEYSPAATPSTTYDFISGDLAADGWAVSNNSNCAISGDTATWVAASTAGITTGSMTGLKDGKEYTVEYDIDVTTAGTTNPQLRNSSGTSGGALPWVALGSDQGARNYTGTWTFTVDASEGGGSGVYIRMENGSVGDTIKVNSFRILGASVTGLEETLRPNKIDNGSFDSSSGWTRGAGWSISGGTAKRSAGQTSNSSVSVPFNWKAGKVYTVSYDRKYTSGNSQTNVYVPFPSNNLSFAKSTENSGAWVTVEETITCPDDFNHSLSVYGIGDFEGEIDNVYISEVTDGTLLKFPSEAWTLAELTEAPSNGTLESFTQGSEWAAFGEYSGDSIGATDPISVDIGTGVLLDTTTMPDDVVVNLPTELDNVEFGDWISIGQYSTAHKNVILRSSQYPIMGLGEDFHLEGDYQVFTFSLVDAETGWKIVNAVGESEAPSAIQSKIEGTFPTGTDTFSIAHDTGFVEVTIGGLDIPEGDYTSNGSTIVLNTPLLNESYVKIIAWNHMDVTDVGAQVVSYDNSGSGLEAANVADAIDELSEGKQPNDNLLINGDMSVNQRGTNGTIVHGTYTLDRFLAGSTDAVGTISVFRNTSNLPQTHNADKFMQMTVSGMTGRGFIRQRVEVPPTFAGKELTLSLQMFHDTEVPVTVSCTWYTTAYAQSSDRVTTDVTYTNDFSKRGTATFTVPEFTSYSNTEEYYMDILINFGDTALPDGAYRFTNLKLEEGSVATPFVADDHATNLTKCQRYYWTYPGICYMPAWADGSSAYRTYTFVYPTRMRISPSLDYVYTTATHDTVRGDENGASFLAIAASPGHGATIEQVTADAEL